MVDNINIIKVFDCTKSYLNFAQTSECTQLILDQNIEGIVILKKIYNWKFIR